MQYVQASVITSALLSGGLSLISLVVMASASAPVQAADPHVPLQTYVQATRLSLAQAIDAAETAIPGRAIDALLDTHAGLAHYALDIITPQGSRVQAHVNATTGVALQYKDHGPASPKDKQQLEASKITLKQALDAALQHTSGTAVEADLGQDADHTVFVVHVVTAAGQRVELTLNPTDGSVLRATRD